MKLEVIKIGKPAFPEYESLSKVWERRISHFQKIQVQLLKDSPKSLQRIKEGMSKDKSSCFVALDETGVQMTSEQLAKQIEKWKENPSIQGVSFVVGGPYGLGKEVIGGCSKKWSLSSLTLPSDLAWLLVMEQLYRALSILAGFPYHHGNG